MKTLSAVVFVCLLSLGARAAEPETQLVPLWPGVQRGQLANGLSYYVLKHKTPPKRAFLWLVVDTGSLDEDEDQRGLAHFVEHMAFQSTKHFPKPQIVDTLARFGMQWGADLNAHTSFDETVYKITVPTDALGSTATGLRILRDWADGLVLDDAEIEAERRVVREEWRLRQSADRRIGVRHRAVMFAGTRYVDRAPIGDVAVIDRAPPEALRRFYRDWYRPSAMAVIVVGDIDPLLVRSQIEASFASLVNPATPRAKSAPVATRRDGTRISIEADGELSGLTISVNNVIASRPRNTRREYRRMLIEQLYEVALRRRLEAAARQPDAPFNEASVRTAPLHRSFDHISHVVAPKVGRVEDALQGLLTELRRAEVHGFSQAELDAVRVAALRFSQDGVMRSTTDSSVEYVEEIIRYHLEREAMLGRPAEHVLVKELLETVTLAELNAAGAAFGGAATRTICLTGPDRDALPSKERVAAIVEAVEKASVAGVTAPPPIGALMSRAPTPGAIVSERSWPAIGVFDWTLSNGVRVLVRPDRTLLDDVFVAGGSPGGSATVDDAEHVTASLAPEIVAAGGVGELSEEALERFMDGKRARVSMTIEETRERVSGSASPRDLETLFQLIHQRMVAPRRDAVANGAVTTARAQQAATQANDPLEQFRKQSQVALYGEQSRRRVFDAADIARVDVERAYAIYRDRFGDAGDFVFAIGGNVDPVKLRPLVEKYLASLPATGRVEAEIDRKIRPVSGVVERVIRAGQTARAAVRVELHGEQPWSREGAADFDTLVALLGLRLTDSLRRDKGGVYHVEVDGHFARAPHPSWRVSVRFGCDPARVDELSKVLFAELDSLARRGPTFEEVDRAKRIWRRKREGDVRRSGWWVERLLDAARFGDAPTVQPDTELVLSRMTPAILHGAAKRFLDARQYVQAVLLPLADPRTERIPRIPDRR